MTSVMSPRGSHISPRATVVAHSPASFPTLGREPLPLVAATSYTGSGAGATPAGWTACNGVTAALASGLSVQLAFSEIARVLSLAWKIMPQQETWEQGQWEVVRELVAQVAPYFPAANCTLLADRGFSCLELIQICKQVQWHYVLRICQEHTVRRWMGGKLEKTWKSLRQIILKPGSRWFGRARVWHEETLDTYGHLWPDADEQTRWRIEEVERAGYDWQTSKRAGRLVRGGAGG